MRSKVVGWQKWEDEDNFLVVIFSYEENKGTLLTLIKSLDEYIRKAIQSDIKVK